VQTVADCDENGNLTLGDADTDGKLLVEEVSFSSTEEENSSACVICLEPFRIGDIVTWSKEATECLHVFHRDCIMQWLENPKHDDCPSCRYHILHFDDIDEEENEEECVSCHEEDEDVEMHASPLAFVIMNGLISRARQASYSLIGSSIEMDDDCVPPPPPLPLRRVISEGPGTAQLSTILRRGHGFRRASLNSRYDAIATDLESPFRRVSLPKDDLPSLKQTINLTRSISEGPPAYKGHALQEPGLFAAGCVAFRRVSSDIYARLSSTSDSAEHLKSYDYDEDLEDEEDIIMKEDTCWRDGFSGKQNDGTDGVDVEMGSSPTRIV